MFRRHELSANHARAQRYARTQHPDPIKDLKANGALAAREMENFTHTRDAPTLRVAPTSVGAPSGDPEQRLPGWEPQHA